MWLCIFTYVTKRLLRYSTIEKAIEQQSVITQAGNCSIVLKDGKVYTGRILQIDAEKVKFENMRFKKQEILTNELSELIIDVKSK